MGKIPMRITPSRRTNFFNAQKNSLQQSLKGCFFARRLSHFGTEFVIMRTMQKQQETEGQENLTQQNVTGRIIKSLGGFYYVAGERGEPVIECRARGVFRQQNIKPVSATG